MSNNFEKPIKILKVCAIDSTASVLLRAQLRAMRDRGWEISIACSDGPALQSLREEGIQAFAIPIARSTNVLDHFISVLLLYRLILQEGFDVVHVHTPVASLIGRLAAWLARVPLIMYTAHGFYFHDEMPMRQKMRHIRLERIFGKLTHHLFTQSGEDAETAVRERIMARESVTRIGNGVSIDDFEKVISQDIVNWRDRLGIPSDGIVVGIVGRVVEEKGYREFFQAAELLVETYANVYFVVVGGKAKGDRDSFQSEIDQIVRKPSLASRVKFTGFSDEIPILMNLMDIFVLPSYREGMPRSIIEAMASGKPVVATNIRGCREEVIDGETGFLVPLRDAKSLATRLSQLIDDKQLRIDMGAAGRRIARADFNEERVIEVLNEKIEELIYRHVTRARKID